MASVKEDLKAAEEKKAIIDFLGMPTQNKLNFFKTDDFKKLPSVTKQLMIDKTKKELITQSLNTTNTTVPLPVDPATAIMMKSPHYQNLNRETKAYMQQSFPLTYLQNRSLSLQKEQTKPPTKTISKLDFLEERKKEAKWGLLFNSLGQMYSKTKDESTIDRPESSLSEEAIPFLGDTKDDYKYLKTASGKPILLFRLAENDLENCFHIFRLCLASALGLKSFTELVNVYKTAIENENKENKDLTDLQKIAFRERKRRAQISVFEYEKCLIKSLIQSPYETILYEYFYFTVEKFNLFNYYINKYKVEGEAPTMQWLFFIVLKNLLQGYLGSDLKILDKLVFEPHDRSQYKEGFNYFALISGDYDNSYEPILLNAISNRYDGEIGNYHYDPDEEEDIEPPDYFFMEHSMENLEKLKIDLENIDKIVKNLPTKLSTPDVVANILVSYYSRFKAQNDMNDQD